MAAARQFTASVDIRILSAKKKSSFRTARIKNFPVVESCEEFRKEVQNLLPGERCVDMFTFGYIDSNKRKLWVGNNEDLLDAYAATTNGNPLWIEPGNSTVQESTETTPQPGQKRSHDTTTRAEDIEEKLKELQEKHGTNQEPYQLKLWAEMLVLGSHKSVDEPPNLPIFKRKVAKRTSASEGNSQGTSATRSEIIKQLKELNELRELKVLTDEEFQEKKKIIMK